LPLVTKQGKQFAARVASSLLTAIGLTELITYTEEEYGHLILKLATCPDMLNAVKSKLSTNKRHEPLFDTNRYVRNFESGLNKVYNLYLEGKNPENIWIKE